MIRQAYILCSCLLLCLWSVQAQQSATQIEFGKNRVQYHQDFAEWSQYESPNFTTYWYGEARNVGQAAVVLAEYDFKEIERFLDHRMNEKVEIVVYTDLSDLKQSNIGVEEAFMNTAGQTKIVGNKAFIYFNGDHNHLRRQIREGIAGIYLESMLFGSNLQEIVQNAVLLSVPEWYKVGLISFVGEEWSTELDDQLRDIILSEKYETFAEFAEEDPRLAGHALWYFLSLHFDRTYVSRLLYLTRINRNLESAFVYTFGSTLEKASESWFSYFRGRYESESKLTKTPTGELVDIPNKRDLPITQLKISPDGSKLVYVLNEIGKVKIYLYDLERDKRDLIFKDGFRNPFQATDYNYPLVAWHPSSSEITILYEKRDKPKLVQYNLTTKKQTEDDLIAQFHRVYSMEYADTRSLLFSATAQGFSDIFLYYPNTRQSRRITRDYYDDLDAQAVRIGNKKGIIWASNRPDSSLLRAKMDSLPPIENFDLFYYDLEAQTEEAVRLTHTPFANERHAVGIDTTFFAFLSDESGIYNRVVGYLEEYIHHYERTIEFINGDEIVLHADSTVQELDSTQIDTSYITPIIKQRAINHFASNVHRNILGQSQAFTQNKNVQLLREENKYQVYVDAIPFSERIELPQASLHRKIVALQTRTPAITETPESRLLERVEQKKSKKKFEPKEKKDKEESDYFFQSDFDEDEPEVVTRAEEEVPADGIDYENFFQSEFSEETIAAPTEANTPEAEEEEEEAEELASFELPSIAEQTENPNLAENADGSGIHEFRPGRITPYRLRFRSDILAMQLNNDLLFGGLNNYSGVPTDVGYPSPGILTKANFKDLLEDYEVEGGVRFPTTFNSGAEYYFVVDDRKKRLDKQYAVYRRAQKVDLPTPLGLPILSQKRNEVRTVIGQFALRYPLDIFRSVRMRATLRSDATIPLASDSTILNAPISREQRIGVGLEYVFDNTLDVSLNIKNGTRYKVFAEVVKGFQVQVLDNAGLNFNKGVMTILGVDFRHYQRLDKKSIFAIRAAGATSFGSERILFQLGGVNQWLFPTFNQNIPLPPEEGLAFHVPVNNMRGFRLNIRNGNSYALLNNELRVPLLSYIFKNKNAFIRNFQTVAFFDVGTAWTGPSPFAEESPLNTNNYSNGPVRVRVNYFRDPIVAGYGVGIRTMLFGYFLRIDRAWGIETRIVQDPRWYFAFGTDF